jgi:hypothetical protein
MPQIWRKYAALALQFSVLVPGYRYLCFYSFFVLIISITVLVT